MRVTFHAACLMLLAISASGQTERGTLAGKVTDDDGAPLSGAAVKISNPSGHFDAKTSAGGTYSIAAIPSGAYRLEVEYPGLVPFSKDGLNIEAAKAARADARLHDFFSLGSVGEDRTFYASVLSEHKAPRGPVPRTPDGHPDFSGVWNPMRVVDPGKPDPLPWADQFSKDEVANNMKDVPSARCLPYGIGLGGTLLPFRMMQNRTLVAFLFEEDMPRQIYLDGRKHPEEPLTPFIGHATAVWDGDTLVIDTVGFNDKTWLDVSAHPHTDKLHVTERLRRPDLGHLELEATFDDPGAYRAPWTMKKVTELAGPDEEVGQYICTENNRDVPHLVGK